jgi:ubiquitin carboxyl-terminal hydrolase 4/11/15
MRDAPTNEISTNDSQNEKLSFLNVGTSREDQRKMADEYRDKPLRLGDKWYLINAEWYKKWCQYIGISFEEGQKINSNAPVPGRIDNISLLTENTSKKLVLQQNLLEEVDYYTVPQELWEYLTKNYSTIRQEVIFFLIFR